MPVSLLSRLCVGMGLVAVAGLSGCSGSSASRIDPPPVSGSSAGQQAVEEFDANHDGAIAGAELDKVGSIKNSLKMIDPSGSGRVTADALTARIEAVQETRLALLQPQVLVTMNDQPLADAEVRFVPEKFMGSTLPTGEGKTGANGVALVSGPPVEKNGLTYTGLPPGFYRIEVTKTDGAKQIVPDRYNSQTTLGVELAGDLPWSQAPFPVALKSK